MDGDVLLVLTERLNITWEVFDGLLKETSIFNAVADLVSDDDGRKLAQLLDVPYLQLLLRIGFSITEEDIDQWHAVHSKAVA